MEQDSVRVTLGERDKGRPLQARFFTEPLRKGKAGYSPAQQQGQHPNAFNAPSKPEESMSKGCLLAENAPSRNCLRDGPTVLRHLLTRLIFSLKRFKELGTLRKIPSPVRWEKGHYEAILQVLNAVIFPLACIFSWVSLTRLQALWGRPRTYPRLCSPHLQLLLCMEGAQRQ